MLSLPLLLFLLVAYLFIGAAVIWLGLRVFPNLAPGVPAWVFDGTSPPEQDVPWPAALIGIFWPMAACAMLFRLAAGKHKQGMTINRKKVIYPL